MMFNSTKSNFAAERQERPKLKENLLSFGTQFADDALLGITKKDLVLIGAPSGIGKTQFCVNMAMVNAQRGRRVHFFALEAGRFEIEKRLKFQMIMRRFYNDQSRPTLPRPIMFDEWQIGMHDELLRVYEDEAEQNLGDVFDRLYTYYKGDMFGVSDLAHAVQGIADESDLIIIDHVHYFDWHGENENLALKEIVKTAQRLIDVNGIPIVLVAHLRKRDRQSMDLAPGLDEFHGSSDLAKIATKAITFGVGDYLGDGRHSTYMRATKNRDNGSSKMYLAQVVYNERKGIYEQEYKIGSPFEKKFAEFGPDKTPRWAGRSVGNHAGCYSTPVHQGQPPTSWPKKNSRNYAPGSDDD